MAKLRSQQDAFVQQGEASEAAQGEGSALCCVDEIHDEL
jgi:hypothetical protein